MIQAGQYVKLDDGDPDDAPLKVLQVIRGMLVVTSAGVHHESRVTVVEDPK